LGERIPKILKIPFGLFYFIGTSEIIEDNLRSSRLKSYKDPPKKRNRNMSIIKREHK